MEVRAIKKGCSIVESAGIICAALYGPRCEYVCACGWVTIRLLNTGDAKQQLCFWCAHVFAKTMWGVSQAAAKYAHRS